MNLLPWKRLAAPEPPPDARAREERNYSDLVTRALVGAVEDGLADSYISSLEIAAGQLSRAFASARVTGPDAGRFDPWTLAQMGRSLTEDGEAVWFRLGGWFVRAQNYGIIPTTGDYQISNPNGEFMRSPMQVFHARWNIDLGSGRGLSALSAARTLRELSQNLERSLATESNAAIGYLLPVPGDGDAGNVEALKQDLANLKGRIAIIETTRAGWEAGGAAPRRDYELARLGPAYPDSSIALFTAAGERVLAACGYPVQLAQNSDGTAQREAWRRYMHGTVAPLGRIVEQAAMAAGMTIALDFETLFASDIQGRARAFQSLVQGGMPLEAAAAASGILTPPETDE